MIASMADALALVADIAAAARSGTMRGDPALLVGPLPVLLGELLAMLPPERREGAAEHVGAVMRLEAST